jgi:hypothetical protein
VIPPESGFREGQVAKSGPVNRCPALPSRLVWFGGSQEEPAIASTRVKNASRGEISTEINRVPSGANGALARKKSPQDGTTNGWKTRKGGTPRSEPSRLLVISCPSRTRSQ